MLQSYINEKDCVYARRKANYSYFIDLYLVLVLLCLCFLALPSLSFIKKMCRNNGKYLLYSAPYDQIQLFIQWYNYRRTLFYYCIDKRIIHNFVSLYKGIYIDVYKPLCCLISSSVLSLFLPNPATGVAGYQECSGRFV